MIKETQIQQIEKCCLQAKPNDYNLLIVMIIRSDTIERMDIKQRLEEMRFSN